MSSSCETAYTKRGESIPRHVYQQLCVSTFPCSSHFPVQSCARTQLAQVHRHSNDAHTRSPTTTGVLGAGILTGNSYLGNLVRHNSPPPARVGLLVRRSGSYRRKDGSCDCVALADQVCNILKRCCSYQTWGGGASTEFVNESSTAHTTCNRGKIGCLSAVGVYARPNAAVIRGATNRKAHVGRLMMAVVCTSLLKLSNPYTVGHRQLIKLQ